MTLWCSGPSLISSIMYFLNVIFVLHDLFPLFKLMVNHGSEAKEEKDRFYWLPRKKSFLPFLFLFRILEVEG